ncbi:hypothetical protein T12_2566 [Trichinella patagoniensis]|uniref:Uncharacterized protein n=1 Tax=Trichinella patagoniensis TaxID=990121 RepID=A0A0V0Z2X2_9BILA|nr:hypothetical protein T12_2566 [Trichinella patagoniensis]
MVAEILHEAKAVGADSEQLLHIAILPRVQGICGGVGPSLRGVRSVSSRLRGQVCGGPVSHLGPCHHWIPNWGRMAFNCCLPTLPTHSPLCIAHQPCCDQSPHDLQPWETQPLYRVNASFRGDQIHPRVWRGGFYAQINYRPAS